MKEVAILTKNILIENDMEKKLQMLGYEVFCSTQMLELLLLQQGEQFLNIFQTIIVSETISDEELLLLLKNIQREILVYRVDSDIPNDQELEKWQRRHQIGWLSKEISLKDLRERFSEDQQHDTISQKKAERALEKKTAKKKEENYKLFISCLSRKERELFNKLYEADGKVIARNELCEQLWDSRSTSSNMAQLSQLIRRIREKMKDYEINSKSLQTHWKNGYSLSKGLFMGNSLVIEKVVADYNQ